MSSLKDTLAELVFYRTYSRQKGDRQESYEESLERVMRGLSPFLSLTEQKIVKDSFFKQTATPAGRYHWVGGTEWIEKPENFSGVFNCSSLPASSFDNLQQAMSLLMQGCGVGLIVEKHIVEKLPFISSHLELEIEGDYGEVPKHERYENTVLQKKDGGILDELFLIKGEEPYRLIIGDSRQGWCQAFRYILEMASKPISKKIIMDVSHVRPEGERIKGFGGVANPELLKISFPKIVKLLNKAHNRKLKPVEVMLIIGTLANLICAGNVRRSAIIFQGSSDDLEFQNCKKDLWIQNEEGKWVLRDPELDGYRMANNTRVFHSIPDYEEVRDAVVTQFYSGEGAIQNALEAIWRANADIFENPSDKFLFYLIAHKGDTGNFTLNFCKNLNTATLDVLAKSSNKTLREVFGSGYSLSDFIKERFFEKYQFNISKDELEHRLNRYGLNPCLGGETLVPVIRDDKEELVSIKDLSGDVRFDGIDKDIYPIHQILDGNGNKVEAPFYLTEMKAETITIVHKRTGQKDNKEITLTPQHIVYKKVKGGDVGIASAFLQKGDILIGRKRKGVNELYEVVKVKSNSSKIPVYCASVKTTHSFETETILVHNCGEVIGSEFHCNLAQVVANKIKASDFTSQIEAFKAASLSASVLLNGSFTYETMEASRMLDPIVQITITGLFDFFAVLFGKQWIKWWEEDRAESDTIVDSESNDVKKVIDGVLSLCPEDIKAFGKEEIFSFSKIIGKTHSFFFSEVEKFYLSFWKDVVEKTVFNYCQKHELKLPNRVTGMQPSGTKSLLTNSSNGIHPSFGKHYIRRVTLQKNEPLALICRKLGFKVVPDPNSKNEKGELLHEDEIHHPDCKNWLVEFPICPDWVKQIDYSGEYDPGEYSFKAMWDFYSVVQNYWSEHNTSATIYFSIDEIDEVAKSIHRGFSDGYISTALMPRSNAIFPRMPFEAISKERYEKEVQDIESRKETDDSFEELLTSVNNEAFGPAGCDSDKCLIS